MVDELVALVEGTIDAVIRGFDPDDSHSYEQWDSELESMEKLCGGETSAGQQGLLASVRAQRIAIAFDAGRTEQVLEQSRRFIQEFPATVAPFSLVATRRAATLHEVGSHGDEVAEVLRIARDPAIQGSEFVFLLEGISRRHPSSLPEESLFVTKVKEAVGILREMGYEILTEAGRELPLEVVVRKLADEIRTLNRQKGLELLTGEGA